MLNYSTQDFQRRPVFVEANFSEDEIGEPILDTELVAGDVLYFPRGTIHQVNNKNNDDSSTT